MKFEILHEPTFNGTHSIPIHVFGDSQTASFKNLVVRLEDKFCAAVIVKHIGNSKSPLTTRETEPRGALQPKLIEVLSACGLIAHGAHRAPEVLTQSRGGLFLLSVGTYQFNQFLFGGIQNYDFELLDSNLPINHNYDVMPLSLVRHFAHCCMSKLDLHRGLELLAESGVRCDYLLPPPPPHRDDDLINRPGPFTPNGRNVQVIPLHLRRKAYRFFLSLMDQVCNNLGVQMLDMRDTTADNDVLQERYELDGVHANGEFARAALRRIVHENWQRLQESA